MSWANSVLPMFTGDSSEKLRIAPDQVQIDTTHFRPQAPAKSALSRAPLAVNRTAVAEYAKKLPLGRLYANGRGFVPNIRQSLYSDLVVALALESQTAWEEWRQGQPACRPWPAAVLGRDRRLAISSLPRVPRIRLVGGHRARPEGRQLHPAVPGLSAPAQVRPAPVRHCADEPAR